MGNFLISNDEPLSADYKQGRPDSNVTVMSWWFTTPARVYSFEIEDKQTMPEGEILSIRIENDEQIIPNMTVPVGMFLGIGVNLMIPTLSPGQKLTIVTRGFTGRIRPLGRKLKE